jgi:hypothetical protein
MTAVAVASAAFVAAALGAVPAYAQGSPTTARVIVGPNLLVSTDGNLPHIEPMLAAHPTSPNVLVAVGMVQRELEVTAGAYASADGGFTWVASQLPLHQAYDPQVAIGRTGTVYYATLADSGTRNGLWVARSEDRGLTWRAPTFLATNQDHEQIAVDLTDGRYAGRVYLGSLYGRGYELGVFRSDDDGRTWRGPLRFLQDDPRYGHNVCNLLVLSDGSVFAPFFRWTRNRPAGEPDTSYAGFALSSDGGDTFTEPRIIGALRWDDAGRPPMRVQFPQFAVNDRGSTRRDRIYMVFTRRVGVRPRLFLQYSDDRGLSWSQPRQVDPGAPEHAEQFQQMVAVNGDGVVGVTWFDTRASQDRSVFDQYFAASVDGGETFLSAVRVSTESSAPLSPGNLIFVPRSELSRDTAYIVVGISGGRLDTGGDYMGLTTDANGVFHTVWTDARSGTYQLYAAAIRVLPDGSARAAARARPTRVRSLRASEFALIFDPARYDAETGIITLPLRIKNLTDQPLGGPLTLVLDVNPARGARGRVDSLFFPTILGAANGRTGPGASFDLTATLGSAGIVEPGATTGPFLLRIRKKSPDAPVIGRMMTLISAAVP